MLHNMLTFVEVEGGRLAVDVEGTGPLILCVPGMGESRASFRHLTPLLADAGFKVAVMDLRGHGDSDASFSTYGDEASAMDALAVIQELSGDGAVIVGNSMGAAIGVLAAAAQPELVKGLVLIGPFVRDHGGALMALFMRVLLAKPWGPTMWRGHYLSLFGALRPADHEDHVARALSLLKRQGRWRAFQLTARSSHQAAERALGAVRSPALVVMGTADRDFKEPEAEADWIAERINAGKAMIREAGHYPMGEQAQEVADNILAFLTARGGKRHVNG